MWVVLTRYDQTQSVWHPNWSGTALLCCLHCSIPALLGPFTRREIYTHMHTCTHAHTHTRTHAHTHARTHTHTQGRRSGFKSGGTGDQFIYTYVCMYVYIYIYIYIYPHGANSKINKGLYVMLFKIVMLATYIWRGDMAHPNPWKFGG